MGTPKRIKYIDRPRCKALLRKSQRQCTKDSVIEGLCLGHFNAKVLKEQKKQKEKYE